MRGSGGVRGVELCGGERLSFNPSIPAAWRSFSFRVVYRDGLLEVRVDRKTATFRNADGPGMRFDVFGEAHELAAGGELELAMPADRVAG